MTEKNRVPGGSEFFECETGSIKTVWKAVCKDAEVKGASPKTPRHTMLTWLAMRGVPKEQRRVSRAYR
jgi:integrase